MTYRIPRYDAHEDRLMEKKNTQENPCPLDIAGAGRTRA